tara:strand:- start:184 stop:783 length:600 start_codon:yes stop_codon:yes gene_type:complete
MFLQAKGEILPRYSDELEERTLHKISLHLQNEDYEQARKLLDEYLYKIEDSQVLLYDVALMFNKAGQTQEALSLYVQLLTKNEAHRAALYDRAELFLEREDYQKAKSDLIKALSIEEHWILYLRLAEIAAIEKDVFLCEMNLMRALKSGMQPEELLNFGKKWYTWSHDPDLGLAIKNVLLLDAGAGGFQIWKRLQQPLQ